MLKVEPIPAFQDNYIWAIHDGHSAAIVDPGEAAPVERFLAERGLALGAIVITHHHGDHQGGVADLLAAHPNGPDGAPMPVVGPAGERIGGRTQAVREGDTVALRHPALTLRVLDVPGHTAGHVAFVADKGETDGPALFCGDTMFASGCGRLFEGTPAQMLDSLDKFAALPGETRVYCAHEYTRSNVKFARAVEPANAALAAWSARVDALREAGEPTLPTTVAHERAVNPFLRSREPSVRQAVQAQGGSTADDASAFGALRAWKDSFR
ncbi:hydroxyacylglutathione hydrolase [Cupriavidus plantarum]|uniref:hydroxyacylglutathione hydrolase n=1 Tax=Cupriavidus plantarum TaxID=942865 RepID=UPI001B0E6F98|nr:hydroxyacylglutathione hydrolase [Cupriavidus plantarum]CAG2151410.1 Hydroxyacylglutathione hydrolase [Cupriavidus plantarum]SMR65939.1 hydroxyacylglutathione hydrolase [Cupriavidus plantarum]